MSESITLADLSEISPNVGIPDKQFGITRRDKSKFLYLLRFQHSVILSAFFLRRHTVQTFCQYLIESIWIVCEQSCIRRDGISESKIRPSIRFIEIFASCKRPVA
ncbi:MAG: hypothetical protein CMF06_12120 [Hyphomonas sp.]|nr:hypothetical protein [Hyphomonas sp.]MBM57537.1 hypothetical protein [Hyphomonas sp.]